MKARIAVLGGDGIGPEVVAEGLKVLDAVVGAGVVNTTHYDLGASRWQRTGEVLPDSVLAELAQADAILGLLERKPDDLKNALVYFMGIDEARFRRPIVPGDQMIITVEVLRRKAIVWKMRGQVHVGSELAAEATLLSSIGQQP